MPQGVSGEELLQRGAWLEAYCAQHGYTYCPRRHIEWFGLVRGT
jgi:7-carboxy-7-deazaguanine synthase